MLASPKIAARSVGRTRQPRSRKRPYRRLILFVAYALALICIVALVADGWSYYNTPYRDRPHHSDYRSLRPAGDRSLLLGIVGASMMILMLIYTIRKRTKWFGNRIPLSFFLDLHIFFGVIGPLLIVLHTSFKVQGLVAVSFWSMVAVAVSGYLGRYLYQLIPRNLDSEELNLKEIGQLQQQLADELGRRFSLEVETISQISLLFDQAFPIRGRTTLTILIHMMIDDLRAPFVRRQLRRRLIRIAPLPRHKTKSLFEIAQQRSRLVRRVAILERVQNWFHYWHVIHKPFAIVMYVIMAVHIGVAVWTGYGWIH